MELGQSRGGGRPERAKEQAGVPWKPDALGDCKKLNVKIAQNLPKRVLRQKSTAILTQWRKLFRRTLIQESSVCD